MSQATPPNASGPFLAGETTMQLGELALIANVAGRLPIVLPALPEQTDETWGALLDQVVERGLLLRNGNDVAIPETLARLLGPVAQADFALEAAAGERRATWLAQDDLVVECQATSDETVRLIPIDDDQFEPQLQAFLGFADGVRGADAEPIPVPADQMNAAMQQLEQGAAIEIPAAPAFAEALSQGAVHALEARWVDGNEVHGVRIEWVDAGADGVWAITSEDGQVAVQQRATSALWDRISALLP